MKIRTIEPVQHDGKALKPGAVLNLDDDAAQQLIDAGAAEPLGGKREQDSGEQTAA
jgi:hypothetical protein